MRSRNAVLILLAMIVFAVGNWSASVRAAPTSSSFVYLPLIARPLQPPNLNPIVNIDQDNFYAVSWNSGADYFVLEESADSTFATANVVYQGSSRQWTVSGTGKLPGTYFYRVKARTTRSESGWSASQAVVVHPLFVGLNLRWDGVGYLNIGGYYQPGYHLASSFVGLTAPDVMRNRNHVWYSPDPLDFGESWWDLFYSLTTGRVLSSSVPADPAWKWGYAIILPYDITLHNGMEILIGGEVFLASGPHAGLTAFGQPVRYWALVNRDRFLIYDDGGEWTQYVHAGEARLHYDAGRTRLLIHSDIKRRLYQDGDRTSYTVHYIDNLTASDSFPGGGTIAGTAGDVGGSDLDRLESGLSIPGVVPAYPSTSYELEPGLFD